jgi:hypothetical protein
MLQLPVYIPLAFIATAFVTFAMLIYALRRSFMSRKSINLTVIGLIIWLAMQLGLSLHGFYYNDTRAVPPHFVLLVLPPVLVIIILFATPRGRAVIDTIPLVPLTLLSTVRIAVELCLLSLCIYRYVPILMTFEGRNYDIIAGITAPLIAYGIYMGILRRPIILLWNIAALLSLFNIVFNAVLSAPLAFQRFAFDQPNVALLYFPFVWLPSFIVPVVLFTHLVAIRRMVRTEA